MKLTFTHAVLENLRSIRAYTLETWGAEQESRWAKFESIRLDPSHYRLRPNLFPGCRIAAEGKHVILFRAGVDLLEVVRVLHAAMDFKRRLSSDEEN